jgi:hypothetical protein
MRRTLEKLRHFGLILCLAAMVAGLNWDAVERFSSDIPNWDQWDAEGPHLLIPWFTHDHFVAHLFQPHNEHRVILTKLQNLAVVLAVGQWDARAQCVVNALLHAAIAVGFWLLGRRWLTRRWLTPYFALTAVLFALPVAWQNVLGGFHSQQYWLIGLSCAAIVWVPFAKVDSVRWWLGLIATLLVMGAMGSGFFAAVVILGVVAWRRIHGQNGRGSWWLCALMLALVLIGWRTRVEVGYHDFLKARSVHDFALSILRSLAWPWRRWDWLGVVLWLPFGRLVLDFVRRPENRRSEFAQMMIALGGWVLLQIVATALVRGAGAEYPASRYMDTLVISTLVNVLVVGRTLAREPGSAARRRADLVIAVAWAVVFAVGAESLIATNYMGDMPAVRRYYVGAELHLRSYLETNDPAELTSPIPYPESAPLVERLSHRELRELMPASVRPPLPLQAAASTASTFIFNQTTERALPDAAKRGLSPGTPMIASKPMWGSYSESGVANTGDWRSATLQAKLGGKLVFQVAGDLGQPGLALDLRNAASGALLAEVRPTKPAGNGWRPAIVAAPPEPFVVVAHDQSATGWFAFTAPVEMSEMSFAAWRLTKHGLLIAEIAAGLALLLAGLSLAERRAG